MPDIYVRLSDNPIFGTEAFGDNVNVDVDKDGLVVGVEVLGAVGVDVDGVPAALAPSAEHAIPQDLVDDVAREIRAEVKVETGPNIRQLIEDGQTEIILSGREAEDIARIALARAFAALRKEDA